MSTITKYVKKNGNGDYTEITTAFNDMLVSGVASAGDITEYIMYVDSSGYNVTLTGYIPNSGTFNIVGSQTYITIDNEINTLSGEYQNVNIPNLNIDNVIIDCTGLASNWFVIQSGFGLSLKNVQIINDVYGIYNNAGSFKSTLVDSCGTSGLSSYFIYDNSGVQNYLIDTSISCYNTGIYATSVIINNCDIHNNKTGIYLTSGCYADLTSALMYENILDINSGSGSIYTVQSTYLDNIKISNTLFFADRIISCGNISGISLINSNIGNSCLYTGTIDPSIGQSNNITSNPQFNDELHNDYRLKFSYALGSPCIELYSLPLYNGITVDINNTQLQLFDNVGNIGNNFLYFTFVQGSTLVFSDYNQEVSFAELMGEYKKLSYQIAANFKFDEYDIILQSSFTLNETQENYPWEWDNINISTAKIEDYNTYIIPRSVIDNESIIRRRITNQLIQYKTIVKDNVLLFIRPHMKGISFDDGLSAVNQTIMWVINGNNQSLIKQNVYTNEELAYYPLLCPSPSKKQIRPSGLIYTGVRGDYYSFIKYSDPSVEILGLSEFGDFYWIPTDIDSTMDIRGIKSYKDNLFITAGQYIENINDRFLVMSGGAPLGKLLQYNNNDLYFNYIKPANSLKDENHMYSLSSGNCYPTDITIYEDGTLFIADYYSNSGIYRYNLAYDYALINSSYDNETQVLLREKYTNISL